MTGTLAGSIGFLDVGANSADVNWLCIVTSNEQAPPEIKLERQAKGKLDTKAKLTLVENGNGGGVAAGTKGEVQLVPKNAPTPSGAQFIWSLTLSTRAGGPDVQLVMSARFGQDPFSELARISATSLQRPDLNSASPVTVLLKEAPVPRLSLGINQASPVVPAAPYRGFTLGAEPASDAGTGSAPALQSLLFRIFGLLDASDTLVPLWDQQSLSSTASSLSEAKFQQDKVRVAEELWARQVTEMLSFTPYGGPSASYGGGCTDLELITSGIDKNATNPRYGIFYACQHLANFGVMSRGLQTLPTSPVFPSGIPLSAGSQCVDTVMSMGGAWIDPTTPPRARTQAPGADPGALTNGGNQTDLTPVITGTFQANGQTFKYQPGAVHLFSNRPARRSDPQGYQTAIQRLQDGVPQGRATVCAIVTVPRGSGSNTRSRELCVNVFALKGTHESADLVTSKSTGAQFVADNTAGPIAPHLGFALRTRKSRVQVFDTGGFGVSGRPNGVTTMAANSAFHGGNFDDPLGTVIKGAHPFRGTGLFPLMDDVAATKLRDHVFKVLRKARPLGLAQFVLLTRDPIRARTGLLPLVIYASPILAMYGSFSDESNYAISRYMWSLRDLPGSQNVEAFWLIYAPLRDLAGAMRDAPRTESAVAIASRISGLPKGSATDRRLHDFLLSRINEAAQVVSRADGTVQLFGRAGKTAQPHPITNLALRGDLRLDLGAGPVVRGQPSYFNG